MLFYVFAGATCRLTCVLVVFAAAASYPAPSSPSFQLNGLPSSQPAFQKVGVENKHLTDAM